ncbi:hypothetical protein N7523_001573 [Penicillium sp. IBT 18751x]|nr:hypothetical protein N7523_001573 [Penicillium sp. IBT 18751x]
MSKGALAHRIEHLEEQLAVALEGNGNGPDATRESVNGSCVTDQTVSHPSTRKGNLTGVMRFLTLGYEDSEESTYLGPSSGLSIAEKVNQIVCPGVETKLLPVNAGQDPDASLDKDEGAKVSPPDDGTSSRILDVYFKNMHVRLPFLDRSEILQLHAERYQAPGRTPEEQFGKFKLFMVYAIGAAILQTTEAYTSTSPSDFLITALGFDPTLRESISIASVEAMVLIVLYNLRTTSNASVWYMIGLAMRTCVDFGLHRKARYGKLSAYESEKRRRLFWTVYIVERHTACSLGRPFSIAEEEIDAEIPANLDDSITDEKTITQILKGECCAEPKPIPTLGKFIASIQLQRIVSEIHTRIYRVDKQPSSLFFEIAPLMGRLEAFKKTVPSLVLQDCDFTYMHWNNSVRMLLQPFLSILPPQDAYIRICLSASGQMCRIFKALRQQDSCGHSFFLVNSVFMAGLTMCFCLFRSPGLWTPAVSNDLRACSSALFVMAERNVRLKNYRDGLETVIDRAMEFVQEASQANSSVQNRDEQVDHPLHSIGLQCSGTLSSSTLGSVSENAGYELWSSFLPDTLAGFQDFPTNRQAGLEGDASDMLLSFDELFAEDGWTIDASFLQEMNGAVRRE